MSSVKEYTIVLNVYMYEFSHTKIQYTEPVAGIFPILSLVQ